MVNRHLKRLGSWLWPGQCLHCRARIGTNENWCPPCHAELPWLRGACPRCAIPLPADTAHTACGQCQQKAPAFDRAVGTLHYQAPVDRLILDLKYHQRLDLARALGLLLSERVRALAPVTAIVPVPLHPVRLRERGYNQSLELARVVARELRVPIMTHAARRIRPTAPQSTLKRAERAHNVRNAFDVHRDLAGARVAIVDDVMTSGHTVNALAGALRRAGADEISVWVVARA